MPTVKLVKPRGAFLASRLVGVSYKLPGMNWNPSAEEKHRVRGFLDFLESRSALYGPFDNEMAHYVLPFVTEVKAHIDAEIERIRKPTVFRESLIAMHAACSKFIQRTRASIGLEYRLELFLACCLGEFRAITGLHIARLACSYDIEVPGEIVAIMPREAEWELGDLATARPETGNSRPKTRVVNKPKPRRRSKSAAK